MRRLILSQREGVGKKERKTHSFLLKKRGGEGKRVELSLPDAKEEEKEKERRTGRKYQKEGGRGAGFTLGVGL